MFQPVSIAELSLPLAESLLHGLIVHPAYILSGQISTNMGPWGGREERTGEKRKQEAAEQTPHIPLELNLQLFPASGQESGSNLRHGLNGFPSTSICCRHTRHSTVFPKHPQSEATPPLPPTRQTMHSVGKLLHALGICCSRNCGFKDLVFKGSV